MYQVKERVRYSEVDKNQKVNMAQIVNYFQDCSTFQSEDLGIGLAYLENKKKAWLLSSWQIIVDRYPEFGENIIVGTWAYDTKGVRAYRNFVLMDERENIIAKANSIWFLLDIEKNRPTKITEEDVEKYGIEEKVDMAYAKGKIKTLGDLEKKEPFQILKVMIDTNGHVNNEKYIEMAMEYLPEKFKIYEMRAEYKKEGMLYDMFYPNIYRTEHTVTVEFQNGEEETYALIQFKDE
ncbi:MAG: acyl-[acyl-carrier-protein] thioesterase [Lachnospiraceae bacterium]